MFRNEALKKIREKANSLPPPRPEELGKVLHVVGTVVEVGLEDVPLGALVRIFDENSSWSLEGEVVGFRRDHALVIPYGDTSGLRSGCLVQCLKREQKIHPGWHLVGHVLDSWLRPFSGALPPSDSATPGWDLFREPINPLTRRRIDAPLDMGVRALNGFLTVGRGQRVGIMAGSGVGKSVLMGMIARYAAADINVIALIGERGREVREFLEENLGEAGLRRSIVIVATGDQAAMNRVRAAHVATAVAEWFREQGQHVLLMMDSLTRVAMAQREIGLAVGEPPTTKGYTPSVFALLPRLLERAGNSNSAGSLTGIYTVLVDGDDFSDPICDSARSILDGHINLSRRLAERNHFPAIDILSSASRVMVDISSRPHIECAGRIREWMSLWERNEDLLSIGAYTPGQNPKLDKAIAMQPKIEDFLRQDRFEHNSFEESLQGLMNLAMG